MVTIDGKWTMEGLEADDPRRIKTKEELCNYIDNIGFLPLFKNSVEGFSVEELTLSSSWWSDTSDVDDPWKWREVIAGEGKIAYGKLFCNRAGFISKEWYPLFASYRRDGYDFDSRYEDGLASHRAKKIMDLMYAYDVLPSNEIKAMAGFGKGGEKGFESVMTSLQMQTYITVCNFQRRSNKKKQEYGWPVAQFTLADNLFGYDHVSSAYHLSAVAAKEKIVAHIQDLYPDASASEIEKVIR
jgi:hypothetical protein